MKKFRFLLFLFIFQLFLSSLFTRNHLYSFHFVDEDEFILGGKLINEGEKPYTDFYIQHQPFPYYLSSIVQHAIHEPDVRSVIKIHHMAVWGWNALWGLALFIVNPLAAVLFVGLWEIIKFDLFGSLFLADSLVAYPIILCIALSIKRFKYPLTRIESFIGLIAITVIVSTWQIGWFFALSWFLMLICTHWHEPKLRTFILRSTAGIGMGLISILVLIHFPFNDWFSTMITTNADDCRYMFDSCSLGQRVLSGLLYPLYTATYRAEFFSIEPIIAFLFLLAVFLLLIKRAYRVLGVGLFIFITLLALRPLTAASTMYAGFHKLPVLASMLYCTICLPIHNGQKKLSGLLFIMFAGVLLYTRPYFLRHVSSEEEYTVQFSRFEKYANRINQEAQATDTLFVMPDEMFVYYLSKPRHASRFIFYLEWMVDKKVYKEEIRNLFKTTPPTWVYADANNRKNSTQEQTILLTGYEGVELDSRKDILYRRQTD